MTLFLKRRRHDLRDNNTFCSYHALIMIMLVMINKEFIPHLRDINDASSTFAFYDDDVCQGGRSPRHDFLHSFTKQIMSVGR